MSEQMTARVDVDLAEGPVLSRRSPVRWVMLVVGLAIAQIGGSHSTRWMRRSVESRSPSR